MEIVLKKVTENDIKIYSNDLIVPNGTTEIGEGCCWRLHPLKQVYMPNTVTQIDERAFAHCTSLKKIEIPKSVKRIEQSAFYGCLCLEEVEIHGNVDFIGQHAFANCISLKKITLPEGCQIEYSFGCGTKYEDIQIVRTPKVKTATEDRERK